MTAVRIRPTTTAYPRQRRRAGRRRGRDRGGSVIEMAILWPVVVIAVFAGIQITTYFTARTVALSAAQVGVATERQYNAVPGSGQPRAETFIADSGGWLVGWQVDEPVRSGDDVVITVHGFALSILPGVEWEIQQSARGTIEQFTELP